MILNPALFNWSVVVSVVERPWTIVADVKAVNFDASRPANELVLIATVKEALEAA